MKPEYNITWSVPNSNINGANNNRIIPIKMTHYKNLMQQIPPLTRDLELELELEFELIFICFFNLSETSDDSCEYILDEEFFLLICHRNKRIGYWRFNNNDLKELFIISC